MVLKICIYRVEKIKSWEIFSAEFCSSFIRGKNQTEWWKEINQRFQQGGESISDYYFDNVRLCQTLKLSEK